jgi:hypothetical protein
VAVELGIFVVPDASDAEATVGRIVAAERAGLAPPRREDRAGLRDLTG